MNIEISVTEVKNRGNEMIGYLDDFNTEIKKFETAINMINTMWNGADALKYINEMRDKYIVGLNEMKSVLEEYGKYLQKVPETYSAVDEAFSTKTIDVGDD